MEKSFGHMFFLYSLSVVLRYTFFILCVFDLRPNLSSLSILTAFGLQLSFGRYQADEQAWVETIKSVGIGGTVRISTMDWLGQSQYLKQTVYWASLSSAISEVNSSTLTASRLFYSCFSH